LTPVRYSSNNAIMPRTARLDTPGLLHHVIIRGIERRRIFADDIDRDDILERLSRLLPETQAWCYAWALLPNHAHFLIKSGPDGISALMKRLLTGYAVSFNKRHKRHGQLFQNRFKSIICQEDAYLLELVRYIHLNPLRAKIVSDLKALDCYQYCGHSALMGETERDWQDVRYILAQFGKRIGNARKKYRYFVERSSPLGRRPELVGGGLIRSLGGWEEVKRLRRRGRDRIKSDQRILGDSYFVDQVLSESEESYSQKYLLRNRGITFDKMVAQVAVLFDLDEEYITGKGRQRDRVRARDLLCYWSHNNLGRSITELSKKLGMTLAAVSFAVSRGERVAKEGGYRLEDYII
jgi:putative transposase